MRRSMYQRRRTRIRSLLCFGIVLVLFCVLLIRVERQIRPTLTAICEGEIKQFAALILANSVSNVLDEGALSYEDTSSILYDDGNIVGVKVDTDKIQAFQSALYKQIQTDLKKCQNETLEVALGTASGMWFFAGKGPTIAIQLLPIGAVSVKIVSQLESAGINQTCHTIRAEITAELQAAVPFYTVTTQTAYTCLLAETVLVGTVPDSYMVIDMPQDTN